MMRTKNSLIQIFMAGLLLLGSGNLYAAESEQVIEADIDRREIQAPKIGSQDIEGGFFFGVLSIENFGSNSVAGLRLAYHITEDFFVETTYGQSTVSDAVIRDEIGQGPFPDGSSEQLYYYNISGGVNLFPGELFLFGKWPVGSSVYMKLGVGTVHLVEDKQSFNFGFGLRLLPLDWLAVHIDMEDLIFEQDFLAGQNSLTHNFQLTTGVTFYF
ncbi:MAG: outer membrane beta-barrel domain-containing protein [Acidiferrobacterales bacterium]